MGHTATPHGVERHLERMELREQRRIDAFAGLVAGPLVIAERLDDVVGGDAQVGRACLEHREHGVEHPAAAPSGLPAPPARRSPKKWRNSSYVPSIR